MWCQVQNPLPHHSDTSHPQLSDDWSVAFGTRQSQVQKEEVWAECENLKCRVSRVCMCVNVCFCLDSGMAWHLP